jgi:hypothetical protein
LLDALEDQGAILDTLSFQQQLRENITLTRQHGDTEERRVRRSEIIDYLNQLALQTSGRSFNELCQGIE